LWGFGNKNNQDSIMDEEIDKIIADYNHDQNLGKILGRFFLIEFLKERDFRWLKDIFPKANNRKLLMEWLVLEMFAMTRAIAGHFGGWESKEGAAVGKIFDQMVAVGLIARGTFDDAKHYVDFVRPRMEVYEKELAKKEEPGGHYWMSKKFCESVEGLENLPQIIAIAESFSNRSIIDKEFIDRLAKP